MNAQGLNLSGVAPPKTITTRAPSKKKTCRVCAAKGLFWLLLIRSVLPFPVSVRVLRNVSSCLLEQIRNNGKGNLYGVIVNKLVRIFFSFLVQKAERLKVKVQEVGL